MAVTRLKRKELRNKLVAKRRLNKIQQLNAKPVIKEVDVEAIKKEFAANKGKKSADMAE